FCDIIQWGPISRGPIRTGRWRPLGKTYRQWVHLTFAVVSLEESPWITGMSIGINLRSVAVGFEGGGGRASGIGRWGREEIGKQVKQGGNSGRHSLGYDTRWRRTPPQT